jgi:hypothetical protein
LFDGDASSRRLNRLMSFLLHFSVFCACAIFIQDVPRGIVGVEEGKRSRRVLVSSGRGKPEYFANEGGGGTLATGDSEASAPANAGSPFPDSAEQPKTTGPKLPSTPGFGSNNSFPGELTPGAGSFALPGGKGLPLGKGKAIFKLSSASRKEPLHLFDVREHGAPLVPPTTTHF